MENNDQPDLVWETAAYTLYRDRVVQQHFTARAVSPTQIISDYQSPVNLFKSPHVQFKFSINGQDNEMEPGCDHQYTCLAAAGGCETPLITFGQQFIDTRPVPDNTYLTPNTPLKIRLDMRSVLAAFNQSGFYTTYHGDTIYKENFNGVFVAGSPAPLMWDFDTLAHKPNLQLQDPDGDGIYEITLILNPHNPHQQPAATWQQSENTIGFPQYTSAYPLADALYNMALEEMIKAVEPDNTFRTGQEWAGVWTRDISYSIILAMAIVQPQISINSLLCKVQQGCIVQDNGTGGAYPVSTDRLIWAIAAWEIYCVTGNAEWLRKAYAIVQKSIDDDKHNIYDPLTGLVRGESSFLDWREQTYPPWMQPADIFASECLGTNAVHCQANLVLAQMAEQLNDKATAAKYTRIAGQIKQGINEYLWQPGKGYYGQYRYGRTFRILSPRAEALGEALTVLFNIADPEKQRTIVANTPVMAFGIPCIYPQIPNIPPYHNNAVWPFVQSYWALAAARAGNEPALTESIGAIYRPAALFLTNKENFVAGNGDYTGTQVNSSNMLWSLAGNLSMTYKVIFGMDFQPDGLEFKPFVPKAFAGPRALTHFKYRQAWLDIELSGYGNQIKSITLNGKALANGRVPGTLTGKHHVKIILADNTLPAGKINRVPEKISPATPTVTYQNNQLAWAPVKEAVYYKLLKNGQKISASPATQTAIDIADFAEYQVIAVDADGDESFASEPVAVYPPALEQRINLENIGSQVNLPGSDFPGQDYIDISKHKNTQFMIPVNIPAAGVYAVDCWYANGNGPISTDNKCALRTLRLNNVAVGTLVFPQRGTNEWFNWGFSNRVLVSLAQGPNTLSLHFEEANQNMNGEINQARLDYLRLIKIS